MVGPHRHRWWRDSPASPMPRLCESAEEGTTMPGKRTSFFVNSFSLLRQTFTEWLEDQAPQLGAALAYYTVFSLAPLVLLLLAVVGFLFHDDPAGTWKKMTEQMSYFLDKSAIDLVGNIAQKASQPHKGLLATIIGILLAL